MEQFFRVLKIEPTRDEKKIKAAYRTLLHHVNPEDDAEGFKRLREAYEQAISYARSPATAGTGDGTENGTGDGPGKAGHKTGQPDKTDLFIDRCKDLYRSFSHRIREEKWEALFRGTEDFDLEEEEKLRISFLTFLMDHFHLPFSVWKRIDRLFRISGCRKELLELFPEPYVDFMQQSVQYEGSLPYDLFEPAPPEGQNPGSRVGSPDPSCDFSREYSGAFNESVDQYIIDYQKLRQYTDMGMKDQALETLPALDTSPVYHPYTELEKARLLLMAGKDDEKEEAGQILRRLADRYPREERILCCYAQYLGLTDYWDEAGRVYESLLMIDPDSFAAGEGMAEVRLHQGLYRESRDMVLDLLERNPQDERLMKDLNEANEFMIRDLKPGYEAGSLDQDGLMDLSWCYYQNMLLEDGIEVMDSFSPDSGHELDYHNLKGRIFLTQEKNREALKHLRPWLEGIRKLVPDGTKKTERRLARLGYAYYTIGAALAGIILTEKKGDLSEAMEYFRKAMEEEKDPGQAVSYQHTMADIWRQKKDYTMVLKVCEDILQNNPQYYPAILLRQEACLKLGMYQECADDFQRAVNLYPYYGKPYATLMKMYFLFGDYKQAGEVLKQAREQAFESDDLSVMKARLMAVTAGSREDLEKALEILDERREKGWDYQSDLDQEEWQEINFRRGLILSDLDRPGEAREAFEEALTMREDAGLLYSYATVLMRLNDYSEAAAYYQKTLKLAPNDTSVLFKLGWCYKEKGDYDEALSVMKNVLLRNPDHPSVRMAMTEIYERMARGREDNSYYEKALPLMQEQLSRYPDAYHFVEMGLLYLDMDRYQDAFVHFMKSVEQVPDNLYAYNNAGNCCLALEKPEEAIPYFKKAVMLMDREISPYPHNNLARAFRMLGRYEEAMDCYRRNLELFPDNDDIWLSMIDCLREQGKYREAMETCRTGITKVKYPNTLECMLLRLYGEMGDRSGFIGYVEDILLKYPENPVVFQLIGETWLYGFSEYDYAIYYIRNALKQVRGNSPEDLECSRGCWYLYARTLLAMNRKQEAGQAFQRYLAACRDATGTMDKYESFFGESRRRRFRIGCAYWFLEEYEKAGAYFSKVLDYPCRCDGCSRPRCCCGSFARAIMMYGAGRKIEAVNLYKETQKLIESDLEHRFELGKLQEELL